MLLLIWQDLHAGLSKEDNEQEMTAALSLLESQGFMHRSKDSLFAFAHDKIQEASSLLAREEERHCLSRTVGSILVSRLEPEDLELAVFIVVDLLNEGNLPRNERVGLAGLNLKASRKAMALSAFESASDYATRGIALVGDNGWKDNYVLTLELYTMATETEGLLGHIERMEKFYQAVVERSDRPLKDKLRVHRAWFDFLAARGKPAEAPRLAIALLGEFGCRFPPRKLGILVRVMWNVLKIKKLLKGNTIDMVSSLPMQKDPTRQQLLVIFDGGLSTHLYLCEDDLMPLSVFRTLQWTQEYGLGDYSAPALATTGIMLAGVLTDLQGGAVFAKRALDLSKKLSPLTEARTLFVYTASCCIGHDPLRDQLKPIFRAYEAGLQTGDTDTAFWAIQNFCLIRFFTGSALDVVVNDFELYCSQMKQFKREKAYRMTITNLQLRLNLIGKTEDVLALFGDVLSEAEAVAWEKEDNMFRNSYNLWQCYLYTIFGEHENCTKLAMQIDRSDAYAQSAPGTSVAYVEAHSKGVSSFAAARKTRIRKYARFGMSVYRRVQRWIEKGNTANLAHCSSLLEAELAAWKGRRFLAQQKFELAILISARGGLMMDAGLSVERFGEYLLELGEEQDAVFQRRQAIQY